MAMMWAAGLEKLSVKLIWSLPKYWSLNTSSSGRWARERNMTKPMLKVGEGGGEGGG